MTGALIRDPADWARESGWLSRRQVATLRSRALFLTSKEKAALIACLAGELDNAGSEPDDYMNALRRIKRKLDEVQVG